MEEAQAERAEETREEHLKDKGFLTLHDELLTYEEIDERRFAGWAMGQVQMAGVNPALLLKYSACATLDPYALPGRASMALFDDLVATASIACERG